MFVNFGADNYTLNAILKFFTYPALMIDLMEISTGGLASSLKIPFVIYPTKNTTSYEAQASKQMLVSSSRGGKIVVNDNIAVMPTVWTIEGYLSDDLFNYLIAIPIFSSIANTLSLTYQKNTIIQAHKSRLAIEFRPMDNSVSQYIGMNPKVAITKLEFPMVPECSNAIPISLTLQELTQLELIETTTGVTQQAAMPPIGGVLGKAISNNGFNNISKIAIPGAQG